MDRRCVPVSDVRAGDTLAADSHFTCLRYGDRRVVECHPDHPASLFIRCSKGTHYLDGQLSEDDSGRAVFVGLRKVAGARVAA